MASKNQTQLKAKAPSREPGSGQDANRPGDVPAAGWWEIVTRTINRVMERRAITEAAAITFYALLAVFPAVAALMSLYGLLADTHTVQGQLNALAGILPEGGTQLLGEQIKRIASKADNRLGWGFLLGLAIAFWSASSGLRALFDAMNVMYSEVEKRSFIARAIQSLLFTFGAIVFLCVALSGLVVLPVILNTFWVGETTDAVLRFGRWPALLILITASLSVLYRYGPSRVDAKWRWVTPGSVFASLAWLIGSAAFSWYATNFGDFDATYGSLGAAVGFMTWIWLSSIVVLVGAALNAESERQTDVDTTTGPPAPIGQRGANVADIKPPYE